MDMALGKSRERRTFELTTNYRNPAEIAEYAATLLHRYLPESPVPRAVRSSGREPEFATASADGLPAAAAATARRLADEVDGTVGVIVPMTRLAEYQASPAWREAFARQELPERVQLLGSLESKGLEFDAVVLVDPERIASESPMGPRTHYVTVTRATQTLVSLSVK
jgi:DNA helicase IV